MIAQSIENALPGDSGLLLKDKAKYVACIIAYFILVFDFKAMVYFIRKIRNTVLSNFDNFCYLYIYLFFVAF